MNVSREIGAFVNSTFRVKIGIKSPQAYNREQFQIGQGGYNILDEQGDITRTNSMYIVDLLDTILIFFLILGI